MKDKKRIIRMLNLIYKIWQKNPDLRLYQLLGNCFNAKDLYYKEDYDLEKRLKEFYNVKN